MNPAYGLRDVAGCDDHGLSAVGELDGGKRWCSPSMCLPRADGNGFFNGCGAVAGVGGRPSLGVVQQPEFGSSVEGAIDRKSTMDCCNSPEFHK